MLVVLRLPNIELFSKIIPPFFTIKEVIFSKTYPSFLTLKEGSTFFTKPLFPQGREDVTVLRCSEPLRYKVGGPKRSSPCFAGWDRLTIACLVGLLFLFLIAVSLCTGRRSNEEYCFILLLIGLHLGRYPSGLWRKSYDRHWHLMNDHNDRGYHL